MTTAQHPAVDPADLFSLGPEPGTPELELTALDDDPTGVPAEPGPTEEESAPALAPISPLVGAVASVNAWTQEKPRLDPTEPPPEVRTVASDREQTVTVTMSRRRVATLEVHPEIWMSDPADVTDAIIDAVNAVLAQHEDDTRAELQERRSGIGEVTRAATELHDSVAEALSRELDDVIASVTRGGTTTTTQTTEVR